jgi:glycosyltransferase involved in cell wall biosynthesis
MRILYIADAASIHTRRWVGYFRDKGYEVHLASFKYYDIPGVKVHVLSTFGLGKLGYFFALFFLPKIFDRVKPDLIHAHYLTSYGFIAALAGLRPLIVSAWGSDVLIAPKESTILRYFVSYAIQRADAVTVLSEHMVSSVLDLGGKAENITPTPFGVDTDFFKPNSNKTSNKQYLKLICTRNFDTVYDISTLLIALKKVFSVNADFLVDLVGDGPLRSKLISESKQLGIFSKIKFKGRVDHLELVELLSEADIFVSPSLSDGNNVSLNEAMACGCFPIATNIPANAQWITDGKNGLLYPPGNAELLAEAIKIAMDNNYLRKKAIDLNRQIVLSSADWRICTLNMENVYQKIIKKRCLV